MPTNDRANVDAAARKIRDEKAAAEAELKKEVADQAAANDLAISALHSRLSVFARALRGRVGVYVRRQGNNLDVAVSTGPPWLRLPYRAATLSATSTRPAQFSLVSVVPDGPQSAPGSLSGAYLSEAEVLAKLERASAELLNDQSFWYQAPSWYGVTGQVIAWPLAVLVYLTALLFGWAGALVFGPIAAWIVFKTARHLWLPLIVGGIAWLARNA